MSALIRDALVSDVCVDVDADVCADVGVAANPPFWFVYELELEEPYQRASLNDPICLLLICTLMAFLI